MSELPEQPFIPSLAAAASGPVECSTELRTRFVAAWLRLAACSDRQPTIAAIALQAAMSRREATRLARDPNTLEAVRTARRAENVVSGETATATA